MSSGTNPTTVFSTAPLATNAEFIITVNTAPGHFDRKQYQSVKRGEAQRTSERPGRTTIGEEAHSALKAASLRQLIVRELRALDPPGTLPLIAITGATGVGTTLHHLTTANEPRGLRVHPAASAPFAC
jgi:hypothetical protein